MLGLIFVGIGPFISIWTLVFRHNSLRVWQKWFHLVCRFLGIQVAVKGHIASGPTLFVSNHISYLDILILGSLLPAHFVAKSEVRRWPLIGWFAHAQGTLFISRKRKRLPEEGREFHQAFARGKSLILFPEGTTGDGTSVHHFKSSFFDMASNASDTLEIQPVSLVYHKLSGRPLGRFFRKTYGWPGTTSLFPHLLQILRFGNVTTTVLLHDPLDPCQFPSRKILARKAWELVSEGTHEIMNPTKT